MFLLRTAFWLTLILLVLPIDREEAGLPDGPGALETLAAVQTVVSDVRGFCDRNPNACATGAAGVDMLRHKAVYSAGRVQEWLSPEPAGETIHVRSDGPAGDAGAPDGAADPVADLIMAADRSALAERPAPL